MSLFFCIIDFNVKELNIPAQDHAPFRSFIFRFDWCMFFSLEAVFSGCQFIIFDLCWGFELFRFIEKAKLFCFHIHLAFEKVIQITEVFFSYLRFHILSYPYFHQQFGSVFWPQVHSWLLTLHNLRFFSWGHHFLVSAYCWCFFLFRILD